MKTLQGSLTVPWWADRVGGREGRRWGWEWKYNYNDDDDDDDGKGDGDDDDDYVQSGGREGGGFHDPCFLGILKPL